MSLIKIVLKLFFTFLLILTIISCVSKSYKKKLQRENGSRNDISNSKVIHVIHPMELKVNNLVFFKNSSSGQLINHTYFTASYSEKDEQPEWVAYKITNNNYNESIERTNDYREDPFVSTKSASTYDYQGSGYDMGHLAPAHDMSHNLTAMSESFYLSNISPQVPAFNRGIWNRLEGKVRYWSTIYDSLYVTTGPILKDPLGRIGHNKVTIPRAFYKVLLGFKHDEIYGIGFIIPQEKFSNSFLNYAVSIDQIEMETGIDFNNNLNLDIQNVIEKNSSLKIWSFPKQKD